MKYANFKVNGPIVFVTINPVEISIQEYKKVCWTCRRKYFTIYRLPPGFSIQGTLSSFQVSIESAWNWLKQNSEIAKQRVKAVFIIECSFWTELMLKSIFLVVKPPVPFHILKTANDAYNILAEKYQITVPPNT